jgi:glycine/D-amino acid oxidase-like deaminating enzyme
VKDAETDVVVVGGGIAGLHIAYELLSTGTKKVTVVEDGSECDSPVCPYFCSI